MNYITPFAYPGTQKRLVRQIVDYFGKHDFFVDFFGGIGTIIMHKEKSKIEFYNDINDELTNFFKVITYNRDLFIKRIESIVNSQEWFNDLLQNEKIKSELDDNIVKAINFFYVKLYGLHITENQKKWYGLYKKSTEDIRPRDRIIESINVISKRFLNVQLVNYDYKNFLDKLIKKKLKNELFYFDPPYPDAEKTYSYSLNNDFDYITLFKKLETLKYRWILTFPSVPDELEKFYVREINYKSKGKTNVDYLISNKKLVKRKNYKLLM